MLGEMGGRLRCNRWDWFDMGEGYMIPVLESVLILAVQERDLRRTVAEFGGCCLGVALSGRRQGCVARGDEACPALGPITSLTFHPLQAGHTTVADHAIESRLQRESKV